MLGFTIPAGRDHLDTQGYFPTPSMGSVPFAQVLFPCHIPVVRLAGDLKQCWVIHVRVSMSDLMHLAGPSASPYHITTVALPDSNTLPEIFPSSPSPASLSTLHIPKTISVSLHVSMFFPLLKHPPQVSLFTQKPQAPCLSLTLLILPNSREFFLMCDIRMNFRKFANFFPAHEHAVFSLISQP